jgi:hypothetical protein
VRAQQGSPKHPARIIATVAWLRIEAAASGRGSSVGIDSGPTVMLDVRVMVDIQVAVENVAVAVAVDCKGVVPEVAETEDAVSEVSVSGDVVVGAMVASTSAAMLRTLVAPLSAVLVNGAISAVSFTVSVKSAIGTTASDVKTRAHFKRMSSHMKNMTRECTIQPFPSMPPVCEETGWCVFTHAYPLERA